MSRSNFPLWHYVQSETSLCKYVDSGYWCSICSDVGEMVLSKPDTRLGDVMNPSIVRTRFAGWQNRQCAGRKNIMDIS